MKKLVLCFDGTGNEFRGSGNTSVVRVLESVRDESSVISFYDVGVGTFSDPSASSLIRKRWTRIQGLAFGYGMKQNLKAAYDFLIDTWEPGDQIYLFGFSRGAYTARALAGGLHMCGLPYPSKRNMVDYAINIHWRQKPDWPLAARFKREFSRPVEITFLGLWDTVKTLGAWDALLQGLGRFMESRRAHLPYTASLPNVQGGRHAVSIDEKRSRFRPNLWHLTAKHPSPENFEQVWFAGVHSDVGGGYSDDRSLGDITMSWMMDGAMAHGLPMSEKSRPEVTRQSATGELHNNLVPVWWLMGWRRRTIPADANVHGSVKDRMEMVPNYRPKVPDDVVWTEWSPE